VSYVLVVKGYGILQIQPRVEASSSCVRELAVGVAAKNARIEKREVENSFFTVKMRS
jgi:hypothetical protein